MAKEKAQNKTADLLLQDSVRFYLRVEGSWAARRPLLLIFFYICLQFSVGYRDTPLTN